MSLVVNDFGKQYKNGTWGVRNLSLTFETGVVGVIGPAGAGKTTLLRLLATVMAPTEGTMTWDGQDVFQHTNAFRRVLGYVPQGFGVYANLSGKAFLSYIATMKGIKSGRSHVADSITRTGLSDVASQKMGSYSKELRQRIGLAQALLDDPQFLFIDEPGAALPPQERVRFYQLLAQISGDNNSNDARLSKRQRVTVIATDDIADVAPIATSLVLLKEGKLLLSAVPAELIQSVGGRVWSVMVEQVQLVEMRRQYLISRIERQDNNKVRLAIISAARPHADAVNIEPNLSDAYVYHLYGGEAAISGPR